jgi:adenylylsulfate kinase-like enzyme
MVIWLIGLSGAGKTVIGKELYETIRREHSNTVFLDGDLIREVMGDDLGHTLEDRRKNADRICRLCRMLDRQGIHVVCAILSLFPESRQWNRREYSRYFEIFVDASMETLIRRNQKGLYTAALQGKIRNVAGIDLPFAPPENPDYLFENNADREGFSDIVGEIYEKMKPMDHGTE